MGSRDRDQTTSHHQPIISSLVVRPSASDGGDGGGGAGAGGRTGGSDYEPGEVRRDPPPYSRYDRFSDAPGHRTRAGSSSPPRRRVADHRYTSDFDRSMGPPRSREFNSGGDSGRYRDSSPPRGRGRGGGRLLGRGIEGPESAPGPLRGEGTGWNNPNIRPREGDWICSDPACANLNFGRRGYCNNCKKPRYGPLGSPRRGYPGPPPPHVPGRRFPVHPLDLSPGRTANGYRPSLRAGPRGFAPGGPPPRHGGRFSDHDLRRDRPNYPDDNYRGKTRFDGPISTNWSGHRDHGKDDFFRERKALERRGLSPPPMLAPPQRGRWASDARERSRSPIRGALPPPRDFRRDTYMERGRDDRHGMGRGRIGNGY